jgi:signal transduction histidine kinase
MEGKAVRGPAETVRSSEDLQELVQKLHQTQSQLIQSEKMASIGQLAAGVAHEINNPVGYVYSNLGSLEKYLKDIFLLLDAYQRGRAEAERSGHACPAELLRIEQEIDLAFLRQDMMALVRECREGMVRVKKIVQDLKDFSRAGSEETWQVADLHRGLDSTLNIVWNELKYKCELRREFGELPPVECLPFQLNQVFMNLLVNAAQAIPEKGVVTVRTGCRGEEAWVEVSDTGTGIRPEHLPRMFEPFFTTKPQGKGTGLGLPVSYGIVQRHHGRIEVESEPGRGTTFRVWLPLRQPQGAQRPGAGAATPGPG